MAEPEALWTPRLVLRPVGPGDAAALTAWWNDPVVRRVHGLGLEPLPEEAARRWLEEPDRALAWIARERAAGVQVGVVEMSAVAAEGRPVFELGIALDAGARGRGFGPELIERMCAWAFAARGGAAVVAEVRLDNAVALHVFRRAGFADEAVEGPVVRMRRARPFAS